MMNILHTAALSLLLVSTLAAPSAVGSAKSPIDKVVVLITEMKAQTEKEATEDMEAYDKYKCWCITTDEEKTAAIAAANKLLDELNAFIQEGAGKEGELKTEIAGLEDDIADDEAALSSAKSMRAGENKEFLAEEADVKETLDLLSQAIKVISSVQLVQKNKGNVAGEKAEVEALVQVRSIVHNFKLPAKFHNVMMKDLFDMLGAFKGTDKQPKVAGSFLGQKRDLPWASTAERSRSEEQVGMDAKPNELNGAAAGAKSYNSRSGGILGILKQMGDENAKDLATSQKEELQAEIDFQKLQAAKVSEIAAATEQKNQKASALADLLVKVAKAKRDVEKTQATLAADEAFMLELTKNCKVEDEEYADRTKVRSQEIKALGETLEILTGDEARSLFDKTISLLQVDTVSSSTMRATRAMQRIVQVAKKHKNWQLASLAVKVKLDSFVKVKKAMDKMHADLTAQQKAEYEKWESCKKEIDTTEDKIKDAENTKEDLDAKHTDLTNTLERLAKQTDELKNEVAEMEVSLKQAGEERKEANRLYQTTMSDQRATIEVLNMAAGRLSKFYGFVEIHAHAGNAAAPPPKPAAYKKQNGGVMQLLATIISDAEAVESQIKIGEQKSQEEYASFVAATTASIEADRAAIASAQESTATAKGEKSETEEAQLANDGEIKELNELLSGIHTDCDFVLKYFDVRQKARQEEMDAITDAKAILSGADFS